MHKPLNRENLSTQLYADLRAALMDGRYAPGQRLTIAGLAEQYGTSITPVREALLRLVSEGALEMRAATSIRVPVLKPESLREIQKVRVELEGLAAHVVAGRITPEQLRELNDIHNAFIGAAANDAAQASLLNRDFHFAILRMTRMPILFGICENMWVLMGPFLRLFHDKMPVRQLSAGEHKHRELLDALAAGDPEASRSALQDDIRWGEEMIRALDQSPAEEAGA